MDGISIGLYYYGNSAFSGGATAGGGSGYFGGTTASQDTFTMDRYYVAGGAGGSSYVSGCVGCRSVSLFHSSDVNTTSKRVHYSKFVFNNIFMKSGIETFVNQHGESETGHRGHGSVAITFLGPPKVLSCLYKPTRSHSFTMIILIFN